MRRFAQSTLAIAHVLYEGAYGLRPVSFVSVGLLGGLTCLLFTVKRALLQMGDMAPEVTSLGQDGSLGTGQIGTDRDVTTTW